MQTRQDHPFAAGPKHILAPDGGGVRGILSLADPERMEALLAEHYGTGAEFRLSDHFALIGGTSTGAMGLLHELGASGAAHQVALAQLLCDPAAP